MTESRRPLSHSLLIVGKELQGFSEEGGSEDLVLTTEEEKKSPPGRPDDQTFVISGLKFCYLLGCNPKWITTSRIIFLG